MSASVLASEWARRLNVSADAAQFGDADFGERIELALLQPVQAFDQCMKRRERMARGQKDERDDRKGQHAEEAGDKGQAEPDLVHFIGRLRPHDEFAARFAAEIDLEGLDDAGRLEPMQKPARCRMFTV